jgi:acyl carrier protein
VHGSDRLREDLGLDSVQNMEFLSRVTERFEIDPEMEQVMRLRTIGEVVRELLLSLEKPAEVV